MVRSRPGAGGYDSKRNATARIPVTPSTHERFRAWVGKGYTYDEALLELLRRNNGRPMRKP
ncbi:MAG TPA: hypothetical protein VMG99_08970 [Thermoplasmata archaeon]|nr:hypothetical protein [Thermoplasmata archaeon]